MVVVGPMWPALYPPIAGGPEVRAAVQAAAEDAVLPTNLGHGMIATRVRDLLTAEGVVD